MGNSINFKCQSNGLATNCSQCRDHVEDSFTLVDESPDLAISDPLGIDYEPKKVRGMPLLGTLPAVYAGLACIGNDDNETCGDGEGSIAAEDSELSMLEPRPCYGHISAENDDSVLEDRALPNLLEQSPVVLKHISAFHVPVITSATTLQDLEEVPGVPLDDGVELLNPELIQGLVKDGTCVLIDVRGADRAAGMIEGAVHVPAISMQQPFVARLPDLVKQHKNTRLVVFFCQFCKHRAPFCANLWREATNEAGNTLQRVALMEGGFRAWQKVGLPVQNEGKASEQLFADSLARQQGMLLQKKLSNMS